MNKAQRAAVEAAEETGYQAWKVAIGPVSARYHEATRAYRAREIGDAAYLAVRREHDAAIASLDTLRAEARARLAGAAR